MEDEELDKNRAKSTECKTLKQIWNEVGGPFWIKYNKKNSFFYSSCCYYFYCASIAPNGTAIGWDDRGYAEFIIEDAEKVNLFNLELCDDPTKPKPQMRVWISNSDIKIQSEDPSCSVEVPAYPEIMGNKQTIVSHIKYTDITEQLANALLPYIKEMIKEK